MAEKHKIWMCNFRYVAFTKTTAVIHEAKRYPMVGEDANDILNSGNPLNKMALERHYDKKAAGRTLVIFDIELVQRMGENACLNYINSMKKPKA